MLAAGALSLIVPHHANAAGEDYQNQGQHIKSRPVPDNDTPFLPHTTDVFIDSDSNLCQTIKCYMWIADTGVDDQGMQTAAGDIWMGKNRINVALVGSRMFLVNYDKGITHNLLMEYLSNPTLITQCRHYYDIVYYDLNLVGRVGLRLFVDNCNFFNGIIRYSVNINYSNIQID